VDVQEPVELGLGGVGEAGVQADPGVVRQKVEPLALPALAQQVSHLRGETGESPV
jgi:hypothetical protein